MLVCWNLVYRNGSNPFVERHGGSNPLTSTYILEVQLDEHDRAKVEEVGPNPTRDAHRLGAGHRRASKTCHHGFDSYITCKC